ncbi:VWA domain-containing protein [Streptomyces sp. NPDC002779]|uniref:VWA domain-containing protein n=1 Tax=Streptomyces sp. NPDC002779 TaxID=3364664 RepID=UPI00368CADE0
MGILTLLRNALGRSRKGRTAEAEGAEGTKPTVPTQPAPTPAADPTPTPAPAAAPTTQVPEPRPATDDEHDLVAAAFDNVTVPKQTTTSETAEPEPAPEKPVVVIELEPVAEAETPEPVTEAEPVAEAETPEPVTEAEPVAEAETPEAEPVAEAETPEPVTEAAPVAEAETPEPVTKTPEPVTEPEPEAAAETPEPKAETAKPVADEEPKPVVAAEPVAESEQVAEEPAAADGEDAPQGPPAPDNETRTGGAGGNNPAEGEAEAEPEPTPPAPATTLTHLKTTAPSLATAYKAATTTLKKNNLTGTRAKVHLVLDRSASMRPYYKDGSAQALAEQTLALAAHLDPEATVHVTFFSTELDGTGELTLTDHENKIDELHAALGRMGRTSYHVAVEEVVTHHQKTTADTVDTSGTPDTPATPATPALVIFQTDGAPDAKTPATQALTDAAKNHPHIHFAFVAFGEHDNKAFDYLRKLKTGNTSFFHAGPTPRELTDTELYTGVLANWKP